MDAEPSESERMAEYGEPTMTFEPYEPTTPLKPLTRFTPSGGNPLLSNLQHQRQYSAPDLSLSPADTQSRSPSPPKLGHTRHQSQGMPLTGDGRAGRRPDNSPGRFGGWLGGTPTSTDVSPDTTPKSKRSITATETTPKNTTPSRFGFFASSMSALTTRLTSQTPTSPQEVDDELCNIDIEAVLYPAQSPTERDTFSPAAYKNLQVNAAGLLHKLQDAYRQRTIALQEAEAERQAEREEMEERELRTRNFKNQLESMAAKAAEQEQAMQRLIVELQAEKKARQEEQQQQRMRNRDKVQGLAEGPLITEDLCVDEEEERKRWRKSDGTVRSDLSIDTDGESAESESIFSRSRSPTTTAVTSATDGENFDLSNTRTPPPTLNLPPKPRSTPQQQPPLTTFQKLVKGISGEDGCSNCRGQDSSVAWDTVSLLRDENRSLKHRVAQLEVVVESALDVVNGIGLP
ncbi:hypothetical protein F4818DRAFT_439056 [Hypoxylon cercidicola]|nr:hypothetical protein F4818DRAFT_439056 [Hypoxylon cercidicola]